MGSGETLPPVGPRCIAQLFEYSWSYPLDCLNTFNMFDLTKITMKRVLAAALLGSGAVVRAECPDYTEYAQVSKGSVGLRGYEG